MPELNWFLCLVCIGLVIGFHSQTHVVEIYGEISTCRKFRENSWCTGVAVAALMITTTILYILVAIYRWYAAWWKVRSLDEFFFENSRDNNQMIIRIFCEFSVKFLRIFWWYQVAPMVLFLVLDIVLFIGTCVELEPEVNFLRNFTKFYHRFSMNFPKGMACRCSFWFLCFRDVFVVHGREGIDLQH